MTRNAGWFFVKNGKPTWVSVIANLFGHAHAVIVTLVTHQTLPP